MWPHIFAAATMNAFNSPSPKATSLMWPQFLANRVALLEGDYCLNKILLMVKHRHRSHPPTPLILTLVSSSLADTLTIPSLTLASRRRSFWYGSVSISGVKSFLWTVTTMLAGELLVSGLLPLSVASTLKGWGRRQRGDIQNIRYR